MGFFFSFSADETFYLWGNKDWVTSVASISRDLGSFGYLGAGRRSRMDFDAEVKFVVLDGQDSKTGVISLRHCGLLWIGVGGSCSSSCSETQHKKKRNVVSEVTRDVRIVSSTRQN